MHRVPFGLVAGLLTVLLLLGGCEEDRPASDPPVDTALSGENKDAQEIRETFNDYKSAVLEADGATASALVSSETLDYYEDMRRIAVSAGPHEIGQQSLINKLFITRARLQIGVDRLKRMTGKELFEYGVERSWISRGDTARQELGDISVSGDVANGEVLSGGPTSYDFFREGGEWKLDFIAILRSVNVVLEAQASKSGRTADEYLFLILESIVGRSVPKGIWERPRS